MNTPPSLCCPHCGLTTDQPGLKSCPLCGYQITKRAVRERPGADPMQGVRGGSPAAAWPAAHAYRLTEGLAPTRTKRLVLIRVALGLALLGAVLLARMGTTGSLPVALHDLPAIRLPK